MNKQNKQGENNWFTRCYFRAVRSSKFASFEPK